MKGIQIQEEMARIVLVCKTRMENWRKKQEDLKTEMEDESNKVDSSLRQEKFLYEKRINQMERDKTDQLNTLNQQYEKLQMQEAEQKDDNQQQMNKMEINHS